MHQQMPYPIQLDSKYGGFPLDRDAGGVSRLAIAISICRPMVLPGLSAEDAD